MNILQLQASEKNNIRGSRQMGLLFVHLAAACGNKEYLYRFWIRFLPSHRHSG